MSKILRFYRAARAENKRRKQAGRAGQGRARQDRTWAGQGQGKGRVWAGQGISQLTHPLRDRRACETRALARSQSRREYELVQPACGPDARAYHGARTMIAPPYVPAGTAGVRPRRTPARLLDRDSIATESGNRG